MASGGVGAVSSQARRYDPDVDVENWPKDVIAGRDPQLERAVAEAMRMLKEHPVDRATKEPPSPTWGVRPRK